jgi:hypothetical protein
LFSESLFQPYQKSVQRSMRCGDILSAILNLLQTNLPCEFVILLTFNLEGFTGSIKAEGTVAQRPRERSHIQKATFDYSSLFKMLPSLIKAILLF